MVPSNRAAGSDSGSPTYIVVDQFGYRPQDPKFALIRDPIIGYDSNQAFEPGKNYEVRRAIDDEALFSGTPVLWKEGAVDHLSGDRGWRFDFSPLSAPGRYYVYDVEKNNRSPAFNIKAGVFKDVLKAATRVYFYQRAGFSKQPPFAEKCWADGAAYLGTNQDIAARDISDSGNPMKVRNLSGGWFDAGDTNKYVNNALQPVQQLLTAYSQYPDAFTDDTNIPESGNQVPDIIDEVRWEMDWLRRMQFADGSVAVKVGVLKNGDPSPPTTDKTARFYVPACTSATIAAAAMFAHASSVFSRFPALEKDAGDLHDRAISAWRQYRGAPVKQTDCDAGQVHMGDADLTLQDQEAVAVEAAVYLFAITGASEYDAFVKANYRNTRPYRDEGWTRYQPDQGDALLFYTTLPDADKNVSRSILTDKLQDARSSIDIYGAKNAGLYQAAMQLPQYHWGSNSPRANYGSSNLDMIVYGLDKENEEDYRLRASGMLHYFHGVNPFGMVYLSNMSKYGATRSVNQIYHTWFKHGSRWDDALTSECGPPPGYVVGGPNANAEKDGVPSTLRPPTGQPPEKSYRDWNNPWPENSWTVTEPGIYYQSAYIKLLAAFAE